MAFLVTGPQGAGKTTVADVIARSFDRGVHVEGDVFLRFVDAGRADMSPDASDEASGVLPRVDVVAARAGQRHAPWLYRLFGEATPRLGTWIDNGRLTPEQTAAAILRR